MGLATENAWTYINVSALRGKDRAAEIVYPLSQCYFGRQWLRCTDNE